MEIAWNLPRQGLGTPISASIGSDGITGSSIQWLQILMKMKTQAIVLVTTCGNSEESPPDTR